ncbi:1,4-dihydroxy-2-naphthoate polyprenyltransferase [Phytoactinopolyspora halotolerans]|uniref:1,4-dihydroxy-2-naphthoate octaprenyltransferase n=1 Tax=Phytoactinopolyspora halotolerans TaxID=1981512 RepID=A0A6L9S4B1_9ACTN|nr:1,4-dihydroxy-2-naphthoate polyprenyltransferase [Phytoactinopolyspora halotolerans]NEE00315.1 1,4-dihydroxy-2-naphthoate polyprenyltransferase [Phytoactinopolyspora halotolerans]
MATITQWTQGARPRTLPVAFAPVLAGNGAAAAAGSAHLGRGVLALVVAVALQIGVNFANDYSDGVRGTDDDRVGPFRLVGSGTVRPSAVKTAAWLCFAVAAVAGLVLVVLTRQWWLLAVGMAAIAAAWYYTGGTRPYGYRALGEVSVFVFFGLVAVLGTVYVQAEEITAAAAVTAVAVGAPICALLVVNNIRDAPKDAEAGKRTLAVVMGDQNSRRLYAALMVLPLALVPALIVIAGGWTALALLAGPLMARTTAPVLKGETGVALIPALQGTSMSALLFAVLLAAGLGLS